MNQTCILGVSKLFWKSLKINPCLTYNLNPQKKGKKLLKFASIKGPSPLRISGGSLPEMCFKNMLFLQNSSAQTTNLTLF